MDFILLRSVINEPGDYTFYINYFLLLLISRYTENDDNRNIFGQLRIM